MDILVLNPCELAFCPAQYHISLADIISSFLLNIHLLILLLLLGRAVLTDYDGVVTFIRLKSKLLQRLEVLFLQFANFSAEHSLRCGSGIDTTGLDGNYGMSTVLEKVVRVERNNTGLIGLSNIGKDTVNHTHEHAVLERVTSILDDGDDVGAGFGNID